MSRTKIEKSRKQLSIELAGNVTQMGRRNTDLDHRVKGRLPLIKCECGAEILLLPDLQAMNRAVRTHVSEHAKKERLAGRNRDPSDRLSLLLSQLVSKKIVE